MIFEWTEPKDLELAIGGPVAAVYFRIVAMHSHHAPRIPTMEPVEASCDVEPVTPAPGATLAPTTPVSGMPGSNTTPAPGAGMVNASRTVWRFECDVPEGVVSSFVITPVTEQLRQQIESADNTRVRWMTIARHAVRDPLGLSLSLPSSFSPDAQPLILPAAAPGETGRLVGPAAPEHATVCADAKSQVAEVPDRAPTSTEVPAGAPASTEAHAGGNQPSSSSCLNQGASRQDTCGWHQVDIAGKRAWCSIPPIKQADPSVPDVAEGTTETDSPVALILFDGAKWAQTALPRVLNVLYRDGVLSRPIVALGLDNSADRRAELGRAETTTRYVLDQALPWLQTSLGHNTPTPGASACDESSQHLPARDVIIAGQSLGGLQALDIGLRYPKLIGNVICNSGSFWWPSQKGPLGGDVAAELEAALGETTGRDAGGPTAASGEKGQRGARPRVYMSVGSHEAQHAMSTFTMEQHGRRIYELLDNLGEDVTFEVQAGGHEMAAWEGALVRGLIELLD